MIQQEKAAPRPEKLIDIIIYNGRDTATLTREVDPQGAIVEHRVKKSSYAHEKMHEKGTIDDELYDGAERFRMDFGRAHLGGKYSTIDMHKIRGASVQHVSDSVAAAKESVHMALNSLGARASQNGFSLSKSCVWYVIGCGDTLEDWALRIRNSGVSMTSDRASGILLGCLEKLAFHYGLIRTADIRNRAARQASQNTRLQTIEEISNLLKLHAISAKGTPQQALEEFNRLLLEKFAKRQPA